MCPRSHFQLLSFPLKVSEELTGGGAVCSTPPLGHPGDSYGRIWLVLHWHSWLLIANPI